MLILALLTGGAVSIAIVAPVAPVAPATAVVILAALGVDIHAAVVLGLTSVLAALTDGGLAVRWTLGGV